MGSGAVVSGSLTSQTGLTMLFGNPAEVSRELTEEDREKALMLWQMYVSAKQWKLSCGAGEWDENWDYWEGLQWQRRRPRDLTQAVVNEIYGVVETFLGHLEDSLPSSIVQPRHPDGKETASMLTKLLNWVDDLNEFGNEVELPARSALVTGVGVWRVEWDYKLDRGRGAPRYIFVDEQTIFFAPWTKRVEEAEYVIEARNVPASFVRRCWERGRLVPSGVWDGSLTLRRGNQSSSRGEYGAFNTTDGASTQLSPVRDHNGKDKDLVTLLEAWIRQDDGSLRYIVCANGVILQDGPSPYDDEAYPYVVFNVIRHKDSIYGRPLVKYIKCLQRELNEMHSYALDQQKYESDSPLVINVANVEEGKIHSNAPGQVYVDQAPSGQGYYLLQKPGMNPRWLDMQEQVRDMIRSISGNVDILRGERPVGVNTLGGLEIVRDEANVLVAKMLKPIKSAIRWKDIKVIDRLRQFLKDTRTVRVGLGGGQVEFIKMNEPLEMGDGGEWELSNYIPDDFEADVDFTPTPPGGYQARFERAMALFQAGAVDAQYLLEEVEQDHAKAQEVIQRMQQMQMQAAQAQAQAPSPEEGASPPQQQADPLALAQSALGMSLGI